MPLEIRNPGDHPPIDDLKKIEAFHGLSDQEFEWLAAHLTNERFRSGEVLAREGEPADFMIVIFEGELQGKSESQPDTGRLFILPAGRVSGKLPFSRMKSWIGTIRAVGDVRLARMPESEFPAMLQAVPDLGQRLVTVLTDRVREVTKIDQNREKLASLGKMAAGLAHELNNPASAAGRAATSLRGAVKELADANVRLATCDMPREHRTKLNELEAGLIAQMDSNPVLDTVALSDREQELNDWFDDKQIASGWDISPILTEAGIEPHCLDEILALVGAEALAAAVCRFAASLKVQQLVRNIENATKRISALVKNVKEYSYMDQAQIQDVDVNRSLDVTLNLMNHRLKNGVSVVREFDANLPKLCAFGDELNSVWTNLIDNAVDAMKGKGELTIRTSRENDLVLVEIIDNGPGIPLEIQSRIFDPFFTTKAVGEGTGFGLDFVYRTVTRHHGDVRVQSEPGRTCFQLRLPLQQPGPGKEQEHEHELLAH